MMLLAAIDSHAVMFFLFAAIACGFAIAVLATSNIVRMAFYLTLSLGATAGLFFLAGAEFLGAMQLMIYVGGTLVLLIFGVMLTAQERFISMKTGAGEWILGAVVGASLLLLLLRAGFSVQDWSQPRADRSSLTITEARTSTPIGLALSGVRVDKLDVRNERLQGGMSGYLLPFVIISMHLLVVLIGAGYMARTKRTARGIILDQPAPTVAPRNRKRPFSVTGGLVSGIIVNFLLAIGCFALMIYKSVPLLRVDEGSPPSQFTTSLNRWIVEFNEALASAPSWLLPTLGLLLMANVLLLVVVFYWQKWGAAALVMVAIALAVCVANGNMGSAPAAVALILALAPVVLLIVLMTTGRQPTMWSQMD